MTDGSSNTKTTPGSLPSRPAGIPHNSASSPVRSSAFRTRTVATDDALRQAYRLIGAKQSRHSDAIRAHRNSSCPRCLQPAEERHRRNYFRCSNICPACPDAFQHLGKDCPRMVELNPSADFYESRGMRIPDVIMHRLAQSDPHRDRIEYPSGYRSRDQSGFLSRDGVPIDRYEPRGHSERPSRDQRDSAMAKDDFPHALDGGRWRRQRDDRSRSPINPDPANKQLSKPPPPAKTLPEPQPSAAMQQQLDKLQMRNQQLQIELNTQKALSQQRHSDLEQRHGTYFAILIDVMASLQSSTPVPVPAGFNEMRASVDAQRQQQNLRQQMVQELQEARQNALRLEQELQEMKQPDASANAVPSTPALAGSSTNSLRLQHRRSLGGTVMEK